MLGDLKIYLALEMNLNNTLTHGKLQVRLNQETCRITTEIMQTYDLLLVKICHSSN